MKWVRPGVIGALASAVIVGFFVGKIGADVFAAFATGLIVYWFKSRDEGKRG